jgi:hypothetical protein
MKVLLDEMVDVRFRHLLPGHDVFSVEYMQWKGLKNGALIARAADEKFDAIVTVDTGIPNQQNPSALPLAMVVIFSEGNDVDSLRPFASQVLDKLKTARRGMIIEIRPRGR